MTLPQDAKGLVFITAHKSHRFFHGHYIFISENIECECKPFEKYRASTLHQNEHATSLTTYRYKPNEKVRIYAISNLMPLALLIHTFTISDRKRAH